MMSKTSSTCVPLVVGGRHGRTCGRGGGRTRLGRARLALPIGVPHQQWDRSPATAPRPLQTQGCATGPETLLGMRHMSGRALVIVRQPRALSMNIGHQGAVALLGHQFASSSLDGWDRIVVVLQGFFSGNHDFTSCFLLSETFQRLPHFEAIRNTLDPEGVAAHRRW